ncbi:hypothetical protein HW555_012557 [Spodoptera exigua]|uniref:Uncharacterized protein n=1 Tax=Spodoptera exigua TaxID=7107 RepID=A0A835G7A3_SPOEX|nr:hypothetical protein HW555_012557 [Spodoptera exigua]
MKPAQKDVFSDVKLILNKEKLFQDKNRVKNALEKLNKAQEKRSHLLSEPELAEEFIRIKNALQYSMDATANAM